MRSELEITGFVGARGRKKWGVRRNNR